MTQRYHVRFVRPNGWTYEMWPSAADEAEAVRTADDLLEYRERIGISDYLEPDGITVRSPAALVVQLATSPPDSAFALRCTRPDGTVVEK